VQRNAIIGFLTAVAIGNLVLLLSQPKATSARPIRPTIARLRSGLRAKR